jgi:hypothetical protein
MSIMMMQWGVMSVCTFIAGLMAEVMPVQWVIGGFAAALIVVTAVAIVTLPVVRHLD